MCVTNHFHYYVFRNRPPSVPICVLYSSKARDPTPSGYLSMNQKISYSVAKVGAFPTCDFLKKLTLPPPSGYLDMHVGIRGYHIRLQYSSPHLFFLKSPRSYTFGISGHACWNQKISYSVAILFPHVIFLKSPGSYTSGYLQLFVENKQYI